MQLRSWKQLSGGEISFWDRQVLGTASDSLVYSEAELARAIADEYDSLLAEAGVITPQQAKGAYEPSTGGLTGHVQIEVA
jgi:hypothetical protein